MPEFKIKVQLTCNSDDQPEDELRLAVHEALCKAIHEGSDKWLFWLQEVVNDIKLEGDE